MFQVDEPFCGFDCGGELLHFLRLEFVCVVHCESSGLLKGARYGIITA
jgi:hypothetical protein